MHVKTALEQSEFPLSNGCMSQSVHTTYSERELVTHQNHLKVKSSE